MRKRKYVLLLLILIVFITNGITVSATSISYEEEQIPQEADTDLLFDADVVKNRTAAKSALADMHGVFVFRSAFITQEALVKEADKRELESVENLVLISTQPKLGYQKWVDTVLTSETEKYIKDVYIEEKENTVFIWIYCIIISICILCIAIRIDATIKKGKGEDK